MHKAWIILTSSDGGTEPYRVGGILTSSRAPKVGGAGWQRTLRSSGRLVLAIVFDIGGVSSLTWKLSECYLELEDLRNWMNRSF
jgi:hypothetical protein